MISGQLLDGLLDPAPSSERTDCGGGGRPRPPPPPPPAAVLQTPAPPGLAPGYTPAAQLAACPNSARPHPGGSAPRPKPAPPPLRPAVARLRQRFNPPLPPRPT